MPIEIIPGYEVIDLSPLDGADSFALPAYTDGKESWYQATVDKRKYKVVFGDETEDSVTLKIIKKEKE